jgi:hypothetical protein
VGFQRFLPGFVIETIVIAALHIAAVDAMETAFVTLALLASTKRAFV